MRISRKQSHASLSIPTLAKPPIMAFQDTTSSPSMKPNTLLAAPTLLYVAYRATSAGPAEA
uniref:Uncharacterized protein n=1 Tax=Arundo donax TaxID=35708 RepID=A0A0A9HQV6_ARUDO